MKLFAVYFRRMGESTAQYRTVSCQTMEEAVADVRGLFPGCLILECKITSGHN